nr:transposase, MuDR, MULE transposase domain protein [Tanacetum cinerariifolium]
MAMKKFNLEANYPLNLFAKLSSIDDNFDITDDHEVRFFVECASNSKDEVAHLYVSQHKTLYDTTRFLENHQENTFYNFFEPTTLENIRPFNNITNMSFDNNGLDLNFGTSDFHNNESSHQNESFFEKHECSFVFRDYHEYEDEKNEFDDVVDDNPLPNYQKWQKYMSFKPDISETPLYKSIPMISKHYKKETDVKVGQIFDNKEALDLAIRLKALDEGYQFLNDRPAPERHAAIALAVQNEFPLAYHDRWSRAHCPLVRYNYLTSNSVESVNACTIMYRKLPVIKLAETYRAMVQDWYYKRRKLAENMTYEITDWATNKVPKNMMKNTKWVVCGVSDHQYQVSDGRYNHQVDFYTGTCQCRKWQLFRLPCGHVIAGTKYLGLTDCLRNMLLTYAQSHQIRLHVYVSRVEISPLVVADQHKDEENKKEKQGKPSSSKKLFD